MGVSGSSTTSARPSSSPAPAAKPPAPCPAPAGCPARGPGPAPLPPAAGPLPPCLAPLPCSPDVARGSLAGPAPLVALGGARDATKSLLVITLMGLCRWRGQGGITTVKQSKAPAKLIACHQQLPKLSAQAIDHINPNDLQYLLAHFLCDLLYPYVLSSHAAPLCSAPLSHIMAKRQHRDV